MTAKKAARRTAVVTALVTPALLLGPAADADAIRKKDPRGDAPKGVDITGWAAKNGDKRIRFWFTGRISLRKLQTVAGIAQPRKKPRVYYLVMINRDSKWEPGSISVARLNSRTNKTRYLTCKGKKAHHAQGRWMSVSAPQKCFGRHAGKMRLGIATSAFKSKKWDDTTKRTKWIRRG